MYYLRSSHFCAVLILLYCAFFRRENIPEMQTVDKINPKRQYKLNSLLKL